VREYASGMAYDITENPVKAHELGNVASGDGPRYWVKPHDTHMHVTVKDE
jgi:hypothetical protein